jgi:hypothetical protein
MAFNVGVNLMFFYTKVLVQTLRFKGENRFALITSKVKSVKADEDDVKQGQTLHSRITTKREGGTMKEKKKGEMREDVVEELEGAKVEGGEAEP